MSTEVLQLTVREKGFYWVKLNGVWTIGEFFQENESWYLIGSEECFYDGNLDLIGERITDITDQFVC